MWVTTRKLRTTFPVCVSSFLRSTKCLLWIHTDYPRQSAYMCVCQYREDTLLLSVGKGEDKQRWLKHPFLSKEQKAFWKNLWSWTCWGESLPRVSLYSRTELTECAMGDGDEAVGDGCMTDWLLWRSAEEGLWLRKASLQKEIRW